MDVTAELGRSACSGQVTNSTLRRLFDATEHDGLTGGVLVTFIGHSPMHDSACRMPTSLVGECSEGLVVGVAVCAVSVVPGAGARGAVQRGEGLVGRAPARRQFRV